MREEAVRYAALGIPVIPLWGITDDGECSCNKAGACTSPGKHPRWPGWQKTSANTFVADGYFSFFEESNTPANIGLRLIEAGLAVIDVDSEEGADLLEDLVAPDVLAQMPAARTGRGMHYFIRTNRRPGTIGPGLEIKSENVVAPPSRHADGGVREWLPGRGLVSLDQVPQLPGVLSKRLVAGESGSTTRTGTRQSESTGSITIISWETIAKMLLDRNVPEELVNKHILGAS
jgi:hypothetical protein